MSHVYELELTWLKFAQHTLNEYGTSGTQQTFINSNWIVNAVKCSLKDQLKQSWHNFNPKFTKHSYL